MQTVSSGRPLVDGRRPCSTDELLRGLEDDDWRVRHEVIDRAIARASDDRRTLPTLLCLLATDPAWEVRDAIAIVLNKFDQAQVGPALRTATRDPHPEVRWSARYSLFQLGLGPDPGNGPE